VLVFVTRIRALFLTIRHSIRALVCLGLLCVALDVAVDGAAAQSRIWYYEVEPGENPWTITRKYFKDGLRYWQPLIERNDIERPRHIPVGTVVRIPEEWLRVVPSAARIAEVLGEVTLRDASGERPAEIGMPLRGGETVVTADSSTALIRFANGTELLLVQESSVRFNALSSYANTLMVDATVRLLTGRIETEVGDAGTLDELNIESPVAVSAVRGTRFRVGTTGDADRVEVVTGRVDMSAAGRTRRVDAGEGTITREGRTPQPPRRLLPPPELLPGRERIERIPLVIELEPVDGAVAYRWQVAPTPQFNVLLLDRLSSDPRARLGDVPDGTYALRARGVDEDGIEGRDLERTIVVDARPLPPFLIAPPQDGRNRTQPPEFRWAEVEGASGYRFRLEPGLTRGFELELPAVGRLTLPTELPLGTHRWRVATIAEDGEVGPYSDLQTFEQLEPTPVLDEAGLEDDDEIAVRWSDAGPDYRYRVQIARDRAFDDLILDETVDANRIAFDARSGSAVYVRVAVVEPDGHVGAFGAVNQVDLPPNPWWPLFLLPFAILLVL